MRSVTRRCRLCYSFSGESYTFIWDILLDLVDWLITNYKASSAKPFSIRFGQCREVICIRDFYFEVVGKGKLVLITGAQRFPVARN